jgi:hypothetical protein
VCAAALVVLAFGTFVMISCRADWGCTLNHLNARFRDEPPKEEWSWMPLGRTCVYPDETVGPGWGSTMTIIITMAGIVGLALTRRWAMTSVPRLDGGADSLDQSA